MYQKLLKILIITGLASGLATPFSVYAAATLIDAFTYGKASGQLRYRFENVDQDGISEDAYASTLRTQLGYTTDSYQGFTAFAQFENVTVIGAEKYNNTNNGKTQFPVVADPDGTEFNQFWLSYETPYSTILKYRRQGFNLDNQRFVGTVNFRQNDQTFDAFNVINTSLPGATIFFAHVDNVNRIFGEDHPVEVNRNFRINAELLNVNYKGFSAGSLTGYAYLLDFENIATQAMSHKNFGLRLDGSRRLVGKKILYTAEYADQSDYKDGLDTIDADYGALALGAEIFGTQIKLNYELLSGDGVYAFQTPLATLHAFNGWADRFLVTPRDGIEDIFLSVGKTIKGIGLLAVYHDYSSDNLGYDYGTEWNFSTFKKVHKLLTLRAEYATYDADRNDLNVTRNIGPRAIQTQDADIIWLTAGLQF